MPNCWPTEPDKTWINLRSHLSYDTIIKWSIVICINLACSIKTDWMNVEIAKKMGISRTFRCTMLVYVLPIHHLRKCIDKDIVEKYLLKKDKFFHQYAVDALMNIHTWVCVYIYIYTHGYILYLYLVCINIYIDRYRHCYR